MAPRPGTAEAGRGPSFFLSPLGIVFTTVVIDLVGFGIVLPILPLWAEDFGASPTQIGLLTASYAIVQLLFAPVWGRLSDRYGRRPVILASLLGSAASALLIGLAGTLVLLFVARILQGISGASYAAAQAYVADVTSRRDRARGMGLIGAAFGLGFILGPAFGAAFSAVDARLPFFVAAGLAALNLAIAYRRLPESLRPGAPRAPAPRLDLVRRALASRELGPLVWLSFIATFAFVAMESTFALFSERRFDYGAVEIAGAVRLHRGDGRRRPGPAGRQAGGAVRRGARADRRARRDGGRAAARRRLGEPLGAAAGARRARGRVGAGLLDHHRAHLPGGARCGAGLGARPHGRRGRGRAHRRPASSPRCCSSTLGIATPLILGAALFALCTAGALRVRTSWSPGNVSLRRAS